MNCLGYVAIFTTLLLSASPIVTAQEKTMTTSTGMELVWIPPGEFMLGSTQQEQAWAISNQMPADLAKQEGAAPRRVKIANGFWLGRTEMTIGQWRKFADAAGYLTEAEKNGIARTRDRVTRKWGPVKGVSWRDPKFDTKPKENYPACCISWNDAMSYCQWLTDTEKKLNKLPTGMICRLPTEAEWEYACRAGTQTKFWWGDIPAAGDRRLNWSLASDKFEATTPADHYRSKGRNKFGLADMLGNLWEWCLDEGDPAEAHGECYKGNPRFRIMKGGGFHEGAGHCRCAARRLESPSATTTGFGFRVAIGAPQ